MKRVLTYGTFDLLHWGHIRLLKRARALGDYLVVGLSTDEFNAQKPGKKPSYHAFEIRKTMLESIRYVDLVIPEVTWEQKLADVKRYTIDVVVMGSDWEGSEKFEYLRDHCEMVYLPAPRGPPPHRSAATSCGRPSATARRRGRSPRPRSRPRRPPSSPRSPGCDGPEPALSLRQQRL